MIEGAIEYFSYGGLLVVLLLGSLGVPIPEEVPIVAAGMLSHQQLMRWWLAFAFAAIAAVTALAVAQVSRSQSEAALRTKAEELAAGSAVAAAAEIVSAAERSRPLDVAVATEARRRGVSLFVFDRSGRLVARLAGRSLDPARLEVAVQRAGSR